MTTRGAVNQRWPWPLLVLLQASGKTIEELDGAVQAAAADLLSRR
jgi:hypothetical protein